MPIDGCRWQGPALRWGAGERANEECARERLLDAARFCFERFSPASTSMADIAAQAKVTRPTVYRYFRSKQDVLDALLRRELEAFWKNLAIELNHIEHFGEYLVDALCSLLRAAQPEGVAKFLFSLGTLPHLQTLLLADARDQKQLSHPVYAYALRPGAHPPADLLLAVEWFNRFAFSYLCSPGNQIRESQARDLLKGMCPWARPAEPKPEHFSSTP